MGKTATVLLFAAVAMFAAAPQLAQAPAGPKPSFDVISIKPTGQRGGANGIRGDKVGRPVIDKTELKGLYDFIIRFSPEGLNSP